jgi:hypothetical protein
MNIPTQLLPPLLMEGEKGGEHLKFHKNKQSLERVTAPMLKVYNIS